LAVETAATFASPACWRVALRRLQMNLRRQARQLVGDAIGWCSFNCLRVGTPGYRTILLTLISAQNSSKTRLNGFPLSAAWDIQSQAATYGGKIALDRRAHMDYDEKIILAHWMSLYDVV
jgi:hypothetical protein